ncbi:hypothetical protein PIIN_10243, partial [Serendipita indica DSM 11827]
MTLSHFVDTFVPVQYLALHAAFTYTLANVLTPMSAAAMQSPSHHSPSPMPSRPISVAQQPLPSVQSAPNVFCNSPSLSVYGTSTPSVIPSIPDGESEISSEELFSESSVAPTQCRWQQRGGQKERLEANSSSRWRITILRGLRSSARPWQETSFSIFPISHRVSQMLLFGEQFCALVIDPLRDQQKRVVLIFDALDECKSGPQRRELLETLVHAVKEEKNLRIFITSRPEPVIEKVLEPLSIKAKLTDQLHDPSHHDNIDDIAIYVHQSLGGRLTPDKVQRLVDKANGLFIWASTACRMLDDESSAVNPEAIYDRLISTDQPGAIEDVYDLVFERIAQASKPAIIAMLGMMLAAFEPLTTHDLEDLIQHVKGQWSAKALVRILGSVFKEDPTTHSIQFRHPTFFEYLRRRCITENINDCDRNPINIARGHGQAASRCLHRLKSRNEGLKFNICQIESSFYLNRQIPDLD